ncbi:MAG: MBL fold metallo-hydrolase [Chromatiales bacterium]|nr:MBL fold metallo-hydrolase [Chromatiales bacterium]
MQLRFLGTGAAFCMSPDNFQSNLLLTSPGGRRLLIDCGTDIRFALRHAGIAVAAVTDIYISHLHADHVGGLEYMGFFNRFGTDRGPLPLYICESIADALWGESLAAGMQVTSGHDSALADYFDERKVAPDGHFVWEGMEMHLVPTRHVVGDKRVMHSYGLAFRMDGKSVYFTADTRYCYDDPVVRPYMDAADVIFHDCETTDYVTGVHAHFDELAAMPAKIRRKTWLYHYDDGTLPDAKAAGFIGYVERGQQFDFSS